MMILSRTHAIALLILPMISLCSCQKKAILEQELDEATAKTEALWKQMSAYEQALNSNGTNVIVQKTNMERELKANVENTARYELDTANLEQKKSSYEAVIAKYRPLVDQYKAKYLR
jgi:chromosome segregation ATPase